MTKKLSTRRLRSSLETFVAARRRCLPDGGLGINALQCNQRAAVVSDAVRAHAAAGRVAYHSASSIRSGVSMFSSSFSLFPPLSFPLSRPSSLPLQAPSCPQSLADKNFRVESVHNNGLCRGGEYARPSVCGPPVHVGPFGTDSSPRGCPACSCLCAASAAEWPAERAQAAQAAAVRALFDRLLPAQRRYRAAAHRRAHATAGAHRPQHLPDRRLSD